MTVGLRLQVFGLWSMVYGPGDRSLREWLRSCMAAEPSVQYSASRIPHPARSLDEEA